MSTLVQARADIERQPVWYAEIFIDQCKLENGVAPCTATEPCYFTWDTCRDKNNYDKGSRTYKFCSRGATYASVLPWIVPGFNKVPVKIDSRRFKAERGELRLKFSDDDPLVVSDPTKSTTQEELQGTQFGRFWSRFMARTPNTHDRLINLYRGFGVVDLNDFELYFRGKIKDVDWTEGGIQILVRDLLDDIHRNKIPFAVSSTNVLTGVYNGGATMNIVDPSEFPDATTSQPRTVKVEDEYVTFTGKGVGTLTGCTPGQYGSTAVSHAIGTKVIHVEIYGTTDYTDGIAADHAIMDILTKYANITDPDDITVDSDFKTTIAVMAPGATTCQLNDVFNLPGQGIFKIEGAGGIWEFCRYNGISGNTLQNCERGLYLTSDINHAIGSDVYFVTFSMEIERWRPGATFQAKIEKRSTVQTLISLLQEDVLIDIWPTQEGKITGKLQAPPWDIPPYDLTKREIVNRTRKVQMFEESRITRVEMYHNPNTANPGKTPDDYDALYLKVGADEELDNFYNEKKPRTIYGAWLWRLLEAKWTADHVWVKYRRGTPLIEFMVDIRDEAMKVGEFVYLTVPEIVDEDGVPLRQLYVLVEKDIRDSGKTKFVAQFSGFGDERYTKIGPVYSALDVALPNNPAVTDVDIDLAATTLTFDDFRSGGTHAIDIDSETITYTAKTDLGGNVIRVSGGARGQDGTAVAAHIIGSDVRLQYSAMSDNHRQEYGALGDANNLLADDGFIETVLGYNIW